MSQGAYTEPTDLPETFPVFPLSQAVLFPRGILPLNIFEPRYLNMIDDVMAGSGFIGMVQPTNRDKAHPELAEVGTLGRVVHYSETDDGRYLISLEGICRFEIAEELPFDRPYREVRANWDPFIHDLMEPEEMGLPDRQNILEELEAYLARNNLRADWDSVDGVPMESLINALSSGCPFSSVEKQALLEATDLHARADCLIALFRMTSNGGEGKTWMN